MSTPTVSASLNKLSYSPGEQMLLTVQYGDLDNKPLTITIVVTDSSGNSSNPVTVSANITDPLSITVTDSDSRAWTKQSDDGKIAVYRSVA